MTFKSLTVFLPIRGDVLPGEIKNFSVENSIDLKLSRFVVPEHEKMTLNDIHCSNGKPIIPASAFPMPLETLPFIKDIDFDLAPCDEVTLVIKNDDNVQRDVAIAIIGYARREVALSKGKKR